MRNFTTSVVIPCYEKWHLTHAILNDLREQEKENVDEVIVVDNGSSEDEVKKGLNFWQTNGFLPIRIETIKVNVGFTLAANIGLRMAERDIAEKHITFLISNDVRITGKFIEQSADMLLGARRALVGNRLIAFDSGWNNFDGIIFDYLEGWFLAATSDGWRDLNYFDPNYAPFDYEDMDLSTTAKRSGYKLVSLNNPTIGHQGAGTIGYNPGREAITKRNREYFRNKWAK